MLKHTSFGDIITLRVMEMVDQAHLLANGQPMLIGSLLYEHYNVFRFMSVFLRRSTRHVKWKVDAGQTMDNLALEKLRCLSDAGAKK